MAVHFDISLLKVWPQATFYFQDCILSGEIHIYGRFVSSANKSWRRVIKGYHLKKKQDRGFLRLQSLVDRGIDLLVYRYFCLNVSYRAKLNFTWESLQGTETALNRLQLLTHKWGQMGKTNGHYADEHYADTHYIEQFITLINHDLNTPHGPHIRLKK